MAALYQHNLHYSPSRVGQKTELNRERDISEVLTKKGWQYHYNHDSRSAFSFVRKGG